jgi:hypothetical protein
MEVTLSTFSFYICIAFCELFLMENLRHANEIFVVYEVFEGASGSVVVKALCYKPEDRGFETR